MADDLAAVERLWGQRPLSSMTRGRLVSTPPKAPAFGGAPLDISLDPMRLKVNGSDVLATAAVRFYDFGVARLALQFLADDMRWSAFSRYVNAVDRVVGPAADAPIWLLLLDQVRGPLAAALSRPPKAKLEEDYLIGMVRAVDRRVR